MDHPMQDAPADVLADARRTLEALKSSGLSREVLLQMWEAGEDRTHQLQHQLHHQHQHPHQQQQTPQDAPMEDASTRAICHGQIGHRPRISVSSTSSGSSGHASIWSMGSANSNATVATHYSQASQAPSTTQCAPQPSVGAPGNLPQVASAQTGWGPGRFNFYWCTSCETRFKRKYDWKRHEEEFHERWKKYPCPEPGCNRSFWGANTFNQHHKASHGCKTCPHSEKVVKYLKRRKYWACGFCSALHPSRERHVEHVARHFESGKTKSDWMHSRVIYGLLHQPLIHEAWKDILMSKANEFSGRQPNFSWNPTQTGRAQGFMENESPGQLQDLLEFFSGPSTEAESIVSIAYKLADLVFLPVPASPPMQYSQCYAPPPSALPQQYPPQPLLPPPSIPSQTLPTQSPQPPVLASQDSSPSPFMDQMRAQSMMPQQMFHTPQPRANTEPLRRASLDRELPPPPQENQPMNFQFMPENMVSFEDWESFSSTVVDESASQSTPMSTEWPMVPVQYYNAPVGP
ncbi:homeobox and C2H2 transcription factor [Colletotrichum tofieldiae]|uniref:Homeobox and C2H2 transcription factor n=1 Tax=Colletotrichum tofieldiae TaxID=708197 RepID=A0A166TFX6_9PEZI|nr:homeobox and C2H2 transcription factor [Colletotrichum tofieldiae]